MIVHDNEFLDALAANQNTSPTMLHEIDSSDVSISREALDALGRAARALLATLLGAGNAHSLPVGEIVKLFAAKLYWNETGGELIMCADFHGRVVCLPVPAEHWAVSASGRSQ